MVEKKIGMLNLRGKDIRIECRDGREILLWGYRPGCVINSVAVSADGSSVVIGDDRNKVYFFNRKGKLLWGYAVGGGVKVVSVSSDGSYVAVAAGKNVYLFNREGDLLWYYNKGGWRTQVSSISLSSDGSYIAAGCSDKKVLFFDRDGELLWEHKIDGWLINVKCVSVSSDGSYVAVAGVDIYVFDREGELLWRHGPRRYFGKDPVPYIVSVAVSSDGSYVAARGDNSVLLFNNIGDLLWRYNMSGSEIPTKPRGVAISSDGSSVAAGGEKVYLFNRDRNVDYPKVLWSYKTRSDVHGGVSMSSDGSYVAAAAGGSLVFFNSEESEKKVLKDAHSLIPDELGSSETYITEKETVTTKERKIPVFVSKTLPSKCPSCDAPFNGKSGDACDYCGAVIKTEERVKKME